MTGFSQPERRGLERSQTAETHPDANLLNAFSEKTLSAREREQVLAHLAICSPCREVVLLATPPALAQHPEPGRQPTFWQWPVLRWGAVAASAVIVVIAISLGRMEKASAPKMAQVTTETAPLSVPAAAEPKTVQEEAAAPAGVKAPQVRYEKVAPEAQQVNARADARSADAAKKKEVERASGLAVGGAAANAPTMTAQDSTGEAKKDQAFASNTAVHGNEAMAKVAVAPPPAAEAAPGRSAASEAVEVSSQAKAADRMQAATTAEMVPKGKQSNALHKAQIAAATPARDLRMNALALDQRWQITPEGYLLSSTDQGKNWARQLPDLRFTHVQTVGAQVWACGPEGVLMHSTDGGMNWAKVAPVDGEATLQGEITSIVFTDVKHGTLRTSKGETWITSDGGQSWKKQ